MKNLVVLLLLLPISAWAQNDKVLLQDVTALTLREGSWTTGRRAKPQLQMKCVGGSAGCTSRPRIAQCYNRGFDGNDVQWECQADMEDTIRFGRLSVSCEGYQYPEDPYILKGSCALEYQLEYRNGDYSDKTIGGSRFEFIGTFVAVLFIVCVVVYACAASSGGHRDPRRRGFFGSGFDGGPGYPPGGPPPSYDDATNNSKYNTGSTSTNTTDGPGFWTGMGMGGLAGYAMGRATSGSGAAYHRPNAGSSDGFTSSGPSTSSSGQSTSTGYASTSRR